MHKLYDTVKVKNWWQVHALTWDENSVINRKVVATAYSQEVADEIEKALERNSILPRNSKKQGFLSRLNILHSFISSRA